MNAVPAIFAALLMLCVVSAASVASGEAADKVKAFVNGIGGDVMATLDHKELTKEAKRAELEALFERTVDIGWIAQFVLPRHWNALTDKQRAEYMGYYRRHLINHYVSKFEEYKEGTRFKVLRVIPEAEKEYLAAMKILRPGETPVLAEYRVRDYGAEGGYKVFDIIIEGASLISAQRSEFTSIANSRGVDSLIAQLAAKANAPQQNPVP